MSLNENVLAGLSNLHSSCPTNSLGLRKRSTSSLESDKLPEKKVLKLRDYHSSRIV